MITLTYPGDWRRWLAHGREWEDHRKAFERRWVRHWHEPLIGVWAKEFGGKEGRPHLHFYVGLPEGVPEQDYEGLRRRTLRRHHLEAEYGRYKGRARLPAIGNNYGGATGIWLRTAWAEIVGTQGVDSRHHVRGVDVAVWFWSDDAGRAADRTKVAGYLAGEAAKWSQKKPPEGFFGVGRYYGRWGRKLGFNPVTEEVPLDRDVAARIERRLARWVRLKMRANGWRPGGRWGVEEPKGFEVRRLGDGVTAFGLGPSDARRLLRWAGAMP